MPTSGAFSFQNKAYYPRFFTKTSTALVYDVLALEALNLRNMLQSTYEKEISDVSWAQFKTMLHYKALWYGKTVKLVNSVYTSQKFGCVKCHHEDHVDTNAAKNILQVAR